MQASRSGALAAAMALAACGSTDVRAREPAPPASGSFGDDVAFLRAHLPDLIVLERGDSAIAVAPAYQGRVMTSTARGERGASYGWIHRALIASGERAPHMNAFGGEDRFWLGPEGGPFALYFAPGAPLDFEHWQVPAAIDTEPWAVAERDAHRVVFRHAIELTNRAGTRLSVRVERSVRLFDPSEPLGELAEMVGDPGLVEGVTAVAYVSTNRIENAGAEPWRPETGLVSIWILSMYRPSPRTTVVIPFEPGPPGILRGPIVNDAYFGPVPPERLRVDADAGVLFFRADGRARGKIGVPWARARRFLGSWAADTGVLTIVAYDRPAEDPEHGYVNSLWTDEGDPYAGDVVNSYNDGPPEPGAPPLGPFYELETSSPAAALAPGEHLEHHHRTVHLEGRREALDAIARAVFGTGLDAIESAL